MRENTVNECFAPGWSALPKVPAKSLMVPSGNSTNGEAMPVLAWPEAELSTLRKPSR
ncbi:hypothetical protein [Bradyrhizobium canariense]|uniref:hypothetical protein n=1 Tax=Bradyrhizobium canariense TaxID=255045 RepID=UPI001431BD78|nr:hypothetical protein [Bradyrhizobium canariense]